MEPTAILEDSPGCTRFHHPTTNAMRTSSDKLVASIFVMTLARYISTVRGLIARSKAVILFGLISRQDLRDRGDWCLRFTAPPNLPT
jgi:hypothetical protein